MQLTRRHFLTSSGSLALASLAPGRPLRRPRRDKVRLGVVGVWNRGRSNLEGVLGEEVVALCDVDRRHLGQGAEVVAQRTDGSRTPLLFKDYRRMLDCPEVLDAVVVSTADHTHASVAAAALRRGLHVYCEKPLAHSPGEIRLLQGLAREKGLVTQMGTQIHAGDNYRRVVELIRSGAIGEVQYAQVWVSKGWADGRFGQTKPAPAHLDWDLWQGPATERPYCDGLHPANWRRFWDYGTGTLGDMACHLMDVVHWALELGQPVRVMSEGPAWHPVGTPNWMRAHFVHRVPKTGGGQRDLVVHWADSGASGDYAQQGFPSGIRFVGTTGSLVCHYGNYLLEPAEKFAQFEAPDPSIPRSVGHYREWLGGITEGTPTTCNFDYSGDLACTIVLGNVAYRVGEAYDGPEPYPYLKRTGRKTEWRGEIEWDAATGSTGQAAADALLLREYREGWEL